MENKEKNLKVYRMCFYREHMAITENIPQLLKICLIIFLYEICMNTVALQE